MIKELERILGKWNVGTDIKDLLAYSYDASDVQGSLQAVVWPTNTQQASELMEYCSRQGIKVYPRGAGTNLSGGAVPFDGIVVDFSRMNRILQLGGDSVVVEPGVVLEDLEKQLNRKNRTLPVLPASDKACTVGGCIAEDSAGMRAIKYGTMKDWVEKVEIVLPDGRVLETADKNFVGSEGILALITKATLKVVEKPETRSLIVLELDSFREVQEKAEYYVNEGASSIEFISERTNKLVENPVGVRNTLIVEFEDGRGEIKDQKRVEEIEEKRKNISSQLASKGYVNTEDPRVAVEKTAEFLQEIDKMQLPSYGHLGYGVIHPRFKDNKDREKIIELVLRLNANPVGEHGIGILKKALKTKGWLLSLKRKYDPKDILNPGKVLPGKDIPTVEDVEVCVLCGMCRSRCPVFKALLSESVSPRGLAIFIEKKLKDKVFWEKCSQCRACDDVCPMNAQLSRKIREQREKLVSEGIETKANKKMMENVREYGNPFGKLEKGKKPKELYCC